MAIISRSSLTNSFPLPAASSKLCWTRSSLGQFWYFVTLLLVMVGLVQILRITAQCNLFTENERGMGYFSIEKNNSTDANASNCVKLEVSEISGLWTFGLIINWACLVISCISFLMTYGYVMDKNGQGLVGIHVWAFGILAVGRLLLLVGLAESDTVRWNIGSTRAIVSALVWTAAAITISYGQKLNDSLYAPSVSLDAVGDLENPDAAAALEQPNTPLKVEDMEQAPNQSNPSVGNEPDILVSEMPSDIHDKREIESGEPEIHLQSEKIEMEEPDVHLQTEEIEMKEPEILLQAEDVDTRPMQ